MTRRLNRFHYLKTMFLFEVLGILCFLRTLEAAPLDVPVSSSWDSPRSTKDHTSDLPDKPKIKETLISQLSTKNGKSEDVGNPSELAWQAWLLVDGNPRAQSDDTLDSASLPRRMTAPRSVFIAPPITDCPEGYERDWTNECIKEVNIDPEAHKDFLVEQLNAFYANLGKPQAASSSSNGPLQVNIPVITFPSSKSKVNSNEKPDQSDKSSSSIEESKIPPEPKIDRPDAILTVYELKDDNKENENQFFLGNKSTEFDNKDDKNTGTVSDRVVPVADFVDETNTNSSGIIDYKIPSTMEKIFSSIRIVDDHDNGNPKKRHEQVNDKESYVSPTLVIPLSPTKIPTISDTESDPILPHNSSLGTDVIKIENTNVNVTNKEIISLSLFAEIANSTLNSSNSGEKTITDSTNFAITDLLDDDNEQPQSVIPLTEKVETETYEDSTETEDEILTHSEAGITVTLPGERFTATVKSPTASDDNETTGNSKISSEVSIVDDFVRETTIVDFNTSKASNTTVTKLQMVQKNVTKMYKIEEETKTGTETVDDDNDQSQSVDRISEKVETETHRDSTEAEDEALANRQTEMSVTLPGEKITSTVNSLVVSDDKQTTDNSEISSNKSSNRNVTKLQKVQKNITKMYKVEDEKKEKETVYGDDDQDQSQSVDRITEKAETETYEDSTEAEDELSTHGEAEMPVTLLNEKITATVKSPIGSHDNGTGGNSELFLNKTLNTTVTKLQKTQKNITKMYKVKENEKTEKVENVFSVNSTDEIFEDEVRIVTSTTERSEIVDTMMASSTNVAGTIAQEKPKFDVDIVVDEKRGSQPFKFNEQTSTTSTNLGNIYDYEPIRRDYPNHSYSADENRPVIRTIDEQRYNSENDDRNFFRTQQSQQNYVRFPSNDRQGVPNYVRFPSEEANSIHNSNDYKERNRRPYGQQNYSRPMTRPGEEIHQKPSYWWLPPSWRTDRQQQESRGVQRSRSTTIDQRSRDRASMLLRFWTRMPLVRDPSLNYQYTTYPTVGGDRKASVSRRNSSSRSSRGSSRRVNYYPEISQRASNGAFPKKTSPPAIGEN